MCSYFLQLPPLCLPADKNTTWPPLDAVSPGQRWRCVVGGGAGLGGTSLQHRGKCHPALWHMNGECGDSLCLFFCCHFFPRQSVSRTFPSCILLVRDSHKSPGFAMRLWTTTGAAAYKLRIFFGGTSSKGFLEKIYLCPFLCRLTVVEGSATALWVTARTPCCSSCFQISFSLNLFTPPVKTSGAVRLFLKEKSLFGVFSLFLHSGMDFFCFYSNTAR